MSKQPVAFYFFCLIGAARPTHPESALGRSSACSPGQWPAGWLQPCCKRVITSYTEYKLLVDPLTQSFSVSFHLIRFRKLPQEIYSSRARRPSEPGARATFLLHSLRKAARNPSHSMLFLDPHDASSRCCFYRLVMQKAQIRKVACSMAYEGCICAWRSRGAWCGCRCISWTP